MIDIRVIGLILSIGGGFDRISVLEDGVQMFDLHNPGWCKARSVRNDGSLYALAMPVERGHIYDVTLYSCELDPPQYRIFDFTCIADANHDGGVGVEDLEQYLRDFEQGTINADVTDDGGVTIEDLLAYLDAYTTGCNPAVWLDSSTAPVRCQLLKAMLYHECHLNNIPRNSVLLSRCYVTANYWYTRCLLEYDRTPQWIPRELPGDY